VVGRPAVGHVVAAGAFGEQLGFLLADLLHIDVEPIWLLAVGGEGDAFAIVTPAAEDVDRVWLIRQVLADPTVADAVVGAAADAFEQVKLRALVAAGVHAIDDLVADRAVVGAADAFVGERELRRPAAFDAYLPELHDAGDVGQEGDESTVRRKRRAVGGANVEEAVDGKARRHG